MGASRLRPGTRVRDYEVVEHLGGGGMGDVYRVRDLNLSLEDQEDVFYAMKVLPVPSACEFASDEELCQQHGGDYQAFCDHTTDRFRREARILQLCTHPRLPRFYTFFSDPERGLHFLVMDYIQGCTLAARLEARTPDRPWLHEADVVRWGRGLCDILDYLHHLEDRTILYGDLKPSNAMVDAAGEVWLVDFGISRMSRARGSDTVTRKLGSGPAASVYGTLAYMPIEHYPDEVQDLLPKELRGFPGDDPRADLFSLGATLYELLTGQLPLCAHQRVRVDSLPSVRQLNPEVSPGVEAAVMKALALRPPDRFGSAREMAAALKAHAGDRDTPSTVEEELTLPPSPLPSTLNGALLLEIVAGPDTGLRLPLEGATYRLGRGPSSEVAGGWIRLGDRTVSREQAVLRWDGLRQGHVLEPLSCATNPTFVNGQSVEGPRPLQPGDTVQAGRLLLRYEAHPQAARLEIDCGGTRTTIPLGPQTRRIGRSRECEVWLDDPTISRRQATLVFRDGAHRLVQESRTTPTLVNGIPVVGERTLSPGDEIRLGRDTVLRFLG